MAANRERRAGAGKRAFDASAIEALKAVRAGQGTRASQVVLKDLGNVYEEYDEATYAELVKMRMQNDNDFIEDDGEAEGYMDDGDLDWGDDEEGQRKRAISKVAMPQRRPGQKGPLMGVDNHVASVFLGAGRAVKPGQVRTYGHILRHQQRQLAFAAHLFVCTLLGCVLVFWSWRRRLERGRRRQPEAFPV